MYPDLWFVGALGENFFFSPFLLRPDLSERVRHAAEMEIYFERLMKWGLKGVKKKDQKIKRMKQPLASAQGYFRLQDPHILQCEEIESHLYLLPLHLSSSAIATSPLVIYLLQHGFSAY